MPSTLPRPAYDPELDVILAKLNFAPTVTVADIDKVRAHSSPTVEDAVAGRAIEHDERIIPSQGGHIVVSIFRAEKSGTSTARVSSNETEPAHVGIYYIHGGGMITGNRFLGIGEILKWVIELGVVCVSVEYRLAPEHPDPIPIEDCYAGLLWTNEHADDLGIDRNNLIITGSSAGGGLAAGTALLARDRGIPALRAQILICPMLDDYISTVSSQQYVDEGTWSRGSNKTGWTCLLGERCGGENVSIYAAPARAKDLAGLPQTFLEVGSAEVFRDEVVSYATQLWASGVQAELHVWPGGFHGFNTMFPSATLSQIANETRTAWLRRIVLTTSFLSDKPVLSRCLC